MEKIVVSPISGNENVELVKSILVSSINDGYRKFKINTEIFFGSLKEVDLYLCKDSGYLFYYPFDISGDDKMYEDLQSFSWYYMPWRWEHKKSADLINPDACLLEIGCGRGGFLDKMKKRTRKCVGLEFNKDAVRECGKIGLEVYNETIENYSVSNSGKFDVVCAFQVLEHVKQPKDFIESALNVLRPGGRFIIAVPNNDSFVGRGDSNFLNMPPHHMGLYSESCLKNLENFFSMKLVDLYFEPLQSYHFHYFLTVKFTKRILGWGRIGKIIDAFIYVLAYPILLALSGRIKGFTVLAEYEKY